MFGMMKPFFVITLLVSLFTISACTVAPVQTHNLRVTTANQDFANCRQFFPNSTPPVIKHQEELKPRALCFSSFAVLHSGKSHTAIYVAERLTKQALLASENIPRSNHFFEDAR